MILYYAQANGEVCSYHSHPGLQSVSSVCTKHTKERMGVWDV